MELKKSLKAIDIFSIAAGAMISSGIFVLPGIAYAKTGPSLFLSYFLAALFASIGVMSQAELVSALPRAGGSYFYVSRSMGPLIGTIDGLIVWFSLALKSSFALIGMAAFFSLLFDFNIHILAIAFAIIFIGINFLGIKEAGRTQTFIVMALLSLMFFYIIRGIPLIKISNFEPFTTNGIKGILSTAGFVFVSYGGVLKVAAVAEEAKNPAKNIPYGMFFALIIVSIIYVLIVLVTIGVLGDKLKGSLTPISDGARAFMGEPGRIAISVAAMLAFISTANAGIIAASRYPFALSRDRLLPAFINKTNKRFKTPHFSILITGIFIIISLFFKIRILIEAASSVLILSFLFSCLSVIIMRESKIQTYKPKIKAPLYPWLQIAGIVIYIALLFEMGFEVLLITAVLIFISLFVYFIYGRKTSKEYALLYLIERLSDKTLTENLLEEELFNIIKERDSIVEDRFDRIIKESYFINLNKRITKEELFKKVADIISEDIKVDKSKLFEEMVKREEESSTVISSFIAVPHLVIEGSNIFKVVIVRNKEGVIFSEKEKDVKAVFFMFGSRDERNFYLKFLSSIAQIALEHDFEKKWLSAKKIEDIKNIILTGKRRRL